MKGEESAKASSREYKDVLWLFWPSEKSEQNKKLELSKLKSRKKG
jgi:hypothetical protein